MSDVAKLYMDKRLVHVARLMDFNATVQKLIDKILYFNEPFKNIFFNWHIVDL